MSEAKREWFEVDYYKVLGVSSTATAKEITTAYRKLARANHPDANQGDEAAEERFKEISAAYDVVGDESRRKEYDQVRQMGPMGGMFGGGSPGGANFDFEGMGDLGDLLGSVLGGGLFGGAQPGARRGAVMPQAGATYEAEMSVTFEEAIRGLTTNLTVGPERTSVQLKVPAGIEPGQRLKIRGKGAPGRGGGPNGDLLVMIKVGSHALFGRKKQHLTLDAPVTFSEAALGADLKVPTFSGSTVTLRIPAGTQSGKTFRVKGHGVTSAKGTGDLLVTVQVAVPEELSDRQRELIEEFDSLRDASPRSHWEY